jgi:putative transposase
MFVAEGFLSDLIQIHGKRSVSRDGGTWYPQACQFLKLEHHIHSSLENTLIEREDNAVRKDRTEGFDDYFPCQKENCNLEHVKQWLKLFVYNYNRSIWA